MQHSKKLLTHGMIALSFFMALSPAQARINTVAGIPTIQQSPGTYQFNQYDESKLQADVLNVLEKRSKEDKEFVEGVVRQLNLAAKDLITEHLSGGLQRMSDDSTNGGVDQIVDVRTFLAAKRSFEASIEKMNVLIGSMSALPSVMKANASLSVQGRTQEIQNRLNIDLAPLMKHYEEQMQAIVNRVNTLQFKIKAGNGVIVSDQVGLKPSARLMENQYSGEEIAEMRRKAALLKVPGVREDAAIKQFNLFALKNLNTVIESYGKTYRLNMDEKGKEDALKSLEEIFFARSVMRATYGIPLGAPKINYDLKTFNWDFFSDSKITFSEVGITDQAELADLHNRIATALKTHGPRAQEIFGANTTVLGRVSSAVTFLKGQSAREGMNVIMLKLLLADIEEDQAISRLGGRRQLKDMIRSRYYSTTQNESYFKQKGRALMGIEKDAWADSGRVGADNIVGIVNTIKPILDGYASKLANAETMQAAVEEMDKLANTKKNQIADDLFK